MGILLDIIIIAIILFTVIISAKRGFVKTAVEVVGFILAIVISSSLGSAVADITYEKVVQPKMVSAVKAEVNDTADELLEKTWSALPKNIASNAERFGISKEKIEKLLDKHSDVDNSLAVEKTLDATLKPVMVQSFGMLFSIILFVLLIIVVHLLASLANRLFSFSIIGTFNRFLGGVIGIAKGVVFAVLFCTIITLIVSFVGEFFIFTNQAMEESYIFSKLLNIAYIIF